ncbi:MAG: hypothetical protein ACU843_17720 [Gammaproteobacteria bacterium]
MMRNDPVSRWLDWLAALKQWWRSDRIRISPGEGRLLRIAAPCILEIDGERWFVEFRESLRDEYGPSISYRCRDEKDRESEIRVSPSSHTGSRNEVLWTRDGQVRWLDESEVGIYPLSPGRKWTK